MFFIYNCEKYLFLKKNRLSLGFTIFEILVVLLFLIVLNKIISPNFNIFASANIRKVGFKIQGLIRETYGLAIFSGNNHRIIYDLDQNMLFVQKLSDNIKNKHIFKNINKFKKLSQKKLWKAVGSSLGKIYKFPNNVIIKDIWIEYFKKKTSKGIVAQYFFSSGYTQRTKITLIVKNKKTICLTIIVDPLSGESYIEKG